LLVDGGYTNQWPVSELHEFGCGTVICAMVSPEFEAIKSDYGDAVSGTLTVLKSWFSCKKRNVGDDPPALNDIQERLMFLVDAMKEGSPSSNTRRRADLILQPPIEGYGLLDFHKYNEARGVGYTYAEPVLSEWLKGNSAGAAWVNEVIKASNQEETKPTRRASSRIQTEYVGREAYRKLRNQASKVITRAKVELQDLRSRSRSVGRSVGEAMMSPRAGGARSPKGSRG
jgi:predicted acylesterase/phospholipase RssA